MARKLSESQAKKVLGVSGLNVHNGGIRSDEFLPELRGYSAIRKFREMRDNDSTVGAVMYAAEQVLRDVKFKVVPANKSRKALKEKEFVESVLDDMEHSLEDHISDALSFLTYGFSWFEVVYKRRLGPGFRSPEKHSKYSDGRLGVRKLATRAPWTVSRFDVDKLDGTVVGVYQNSGYFGKVNYIPASKSLYYRTATINNDPSGRSILRNAYTPYKYLATYRTLKPLLLSVS